MCGRAVLSHLELLHVLPSETALTTSGTGFDIKSRGKVATRCCNEGESNNSPILILFDPHKKFNFFRGPQLLAWRDPLFSMGFPF